MELLIAILVWLGCFHAHGNYTQSLMQQQLGANQAAVATVLEDPAMQAIVWDSCGVIVPTITIRPDDY